MNNFGGFANKTRKRMELLGKLLFHSPTQMSNSPDSIHHKKKSIMQNLLENIFFGRLELNRKIDGKAHAHTQTT